MEQRQLRKIHDELIRKLMDEGRIIEGGWTFMRMAVLPPDCSNVQVREMRKVFFAGALHLFASVMSGLDDDSEPTENDYDRMDRIARELEGFLQEMKNEAARMEKGD